MPRPLGDIRILLSSRVLLDLEEANRIFEDTRAKTLEAALPVVLRELNESLAGKTPAQREMTLRGKTAEDRAESVARDRAHKAAVQTYSDYLHARGAYEKDKDPELGCRRLNKGPMFDVALALYKLNRLSEEPIVEVAISCKDEIDSARAIFRNLLATELGTGLEFRIATHGCPVDEKVHKAFKTDIFLTRNEAEAQIAVDLGIAAAVVNFPPRGTYDFDSNNPVLIIVDGDAVAFGDSAEVGFRKDVDETPVYNDAIPKYKNREKTQAGIPVEPGPWTAALAKIADINSRFLRDEAPLRIGMLTARGGDSSDRSLTTLEAHGVNFNYTSGFMGGADKGVWLEAHRPHLFVDDQVTHLKRGAEFCPTGQVPYVTGRAMKAYELQKQAASSQRVTEFATAAACGKTCDAPDCADVHRTLKTGEPGLGPR